MNRSRVLFCLVLILLFLMPGCREKYQTGRGNVSGLFSYIPSEASMIFAMNFNKLSQLAVYDQFIEDFKKKKTDSPHSLYESYKKFITEGGIKIKEDLRSVLLIGFGELELKMAKRQSDFAAIINLDFDREKLVDFIESSHKIEFFEKNYRGKNIYRIEITEKEELFFSLIDDTNISLGRINRLKQIIELFTGRGKSILDDPKKVSYLNKIKPDSLALFLFDLPQQLKQISSESEKKFILFDVDLSKVEVLLGYVNYENKVWQGEFKLISGDEESNKKIVSLLNGFKGMLAFAGPEVAELISNLNISSFNEGIQMKFSITEELLRKLRKKATSGKGCLPVDTAKQPV